ncbi:MAG: DnaJ domain-containing protein [Armatimonadetes bacterium]|nr:DnaJ domain-containing protein [Armatimonadota bacterium]
MRDYYRALGVTEDADLATIKRAYRKLARKLHPDVNSARDSARRMVELNEAYRTISDTALRAGYDARRRKGIPDAPPPPTAAGAVRVQHHLSIADLSSPVYSLAFSPNGRKLAVGCFDNVIRFARPADGSTLGTAELNKGAVSTLRWTSNRTLIAAGASDKSVTMWRVQDQQVVETRGKRADWVSDVAISPDGNRVALGSVHRSVVCVDRRTGKQLFIRRPHDDAVTTVAFSSDGRLVASGGNDQQVFLFEARSGLTRCLSN